MFRFLKIFIDNINKTSENIVLKLLNSGVTISSSLVAL